MTTQLQQTLTNRVHEVLAQAREMYGVSLHQVDIVFKTKGRAAGRAKGNGWAMTDAGPKRKYILELSVEAAQIDLEDALEDTIPHEIAHLVCFENPLLGKNHNPGWKRVCIRLGGSGKRCHTMDLTPAKRVRKYKYIDTTGAEIEVGPKVHKKIQELNKVYVNRTTRGKIIKTGWVSEPTEAAPVKVAARSSVPTTRRPARKSAGAPTKADRARLIIKNAGNAPAKEIIVSLMLELDMTKAGATTYYYKYK